MQPANDDEPLSFGRMPEGLDDLDRLLAWLLVELAEDDVDHVTLALEARLVKGRIHQMRPPERTSPRFTVVR